MAADELRRQADVFIDLITLQPKIGRDPSERPPPREPRHSGIPSKFRTGAPVAQGNDTDFDN
jgi:hypothetical protein